MGNVFDVAYTYSGIMTSSATSWKQGKEIAMLNLHDFTISM